MTIVSVIICVLLGVICLLLGMLLWQQWKNNDSSVPMRTAAIATNPSSVSILQDAQIEAVAEMRKVVNDREELNSVDQPLLTAFVKVMEEDFAFKDPNITIDGLARQLGTNRTYLSALVNTHFRGSFREILTIYRIEYAMKYMCKTPMASLDEVAENCGYGSASSFAHRFKDVTGLTPRAWLSMYV